MRLRTTKMRLTPFLLLLAGCGGRQTAGVRVDPALAMMAPSDTVLLAGARIDKIRETEAYRKFVAERRSATLDAFVRDTGLDPRKDVWEILVAHTGKHPVLLARGKFSPTGGLEPRLREGAPRRLYKGYTLIGDERASIAFVNSSTAVAGPAPAVRLALDERGKSSGIPAAVLEKMKTLPPASQAWAVSVAGPGDIPLPVPLTGNLANLARLFRSIEGGTAGADFRNGLDAEAALTSPDASAARQIHDALRGLIGIGRLSAPDNQRELLRFFDAIQVSQEERTVRVRASIPLDLLIAFESFLGGKPALLR